MLPKAHISMENAAEDSCKDDSTSRDEGSSFHTAVEAISWKPEDFAESSNDLDQPTSTPSSEYFSTRIEKMMQSKSNFSSEIDFEIECSKDHWSQVDPAYSMDSECSMEDTIKANQAVFEDLKKHPGWGKFFKDYGSGKLVVGKKIAEGGQAEIFEALLHLKDGKVDDGWLLKVFKEGSFLRDLQKQWTPGFLESTKCPGTDIFLIYECIQMLGATLLEDGRFAFLIQKCWGDLRKFIDIKMKRNNNGGPPFSDAMAREFMSDIAMGMLGLYRDNIIHRDIKASNVLIVFRNDDPYVLVSDFESSIGVVGTGFWRAPEILLALRNRSISSTLFTEKTDVYSYAMTCYEILTGHIPFEDEKLSNYDIVLSGQRPQLPKDLDSNTLNCRVKALINKCWHHDPIERPTFKDIVRFWDEILEPYDYRLRRVQKLLKMF